mmetsp:Transcript_3661/g.5567  ORF Transcript_3661/g.5567 Transcript_3661/m.5567 type:complete len:95 (-) Transcript_3661:411-695(-)
MFSSAEWWWGEEGANAAGDVVESAQPNRRLLPPLGWANVIGETTSIITIVVANIVKNDLLGIIPSFRRLVGSFARLFCCNDYKVSSLLIDWRGE